MGAIRSASGGRLPGASNPSRLRGPGSWCKSSSLVQHTHQAVPLRACGAGPARGVGGETSSGRQDAGLVVRPHALELGYASPSRRRACGSAVQSVGAAWPARVVERRKARAGRHRPAVDDGSFPPSMTSSTCHGLRVGSVCEVLAAPTCVIAAQAVPCGRNRTQHAIASTRRSRLRWHALCELGAC